MKIRFWASGKIFSQFLTQLARFDCWFHSGPDNAIMTFNTVHHLGVDKLTFCCKSPPLSPTSHPTPPANSPPTPHRNSRPFPPQIQYWLLRREICLSIGVNISRDTKYGKKLREIDFLSK